MIALYSCEMAKFGGCRKTDVFRSAKTSSLKATFHYSSKLQTWLQTWLSTRFAARFSTSSCGFATYFRHVFDTFSTFLSKTWSRTCCINLDVRSSLGFKQVCSWLSTCFRHAFDLLATCFRHAHASRKPNLQPGLQLARKMECGLDGLYLVL